MAAQPTSNTPRIYSHTWPGLRGCTHEEYVDAQGRRVYPARVWELNLLVTRAQPPYPCPSCTDPEGDHNFMMTAPLARPTTPAPAPSASSSQGLNPGAAPFVPRRTAQEVLDYLHSGLPQLPPRRRHRQGYPCPYRDTRCHWHYSGSKPCHLEVWQCRQAQQAIAAAYSNRGDWTGAPPGWNQQHARCIRADNPQRCPHHERLWRESQPVTLRPPPSRS